MAYLETLREILPGGTAGKLSARLPDGLTGYLEGGDGGEEFSVWEFYERFAQKAGIGPGQATRYARYAGGVVGEVMTDEELEAAREELPPEYWELSERVLPDPNYHGSIERVPDSLDSSDAPVT